jgi:hypothetical protein
MIKINLHNIEDLVFKNEKIRQLFPELRHIFDKWLLSYRTPAFFNMKKMALAELLSALDPLDLEKLAEYFNDMVFIENLDTNIVKNLTFPINHDIEQELTKYVHYANMTVSRNANVVNLTLWR